MQRNGKHRGVRWALWLGWGVSGFSGIAGATVAPELTIHGLRWDAHEVTIGQVKRMAQATGFVSQAERDGGGSVYEAGWTQKPGWTWRAPYGQAGSDAEPAVHLDFDEAQRICQFFGKRLPTDAEWTRAAYLEQRQPAPAGWETGRRYPYPNGASAQGSQCLSGCGSSRGVAPEGRLWRGQGHVPVMQTQPGVNGLWDMGGNVWEWVDGGSDRERITRGGSWWYGPARQREDDVATKPRDTRVVYIGFRCVAPIK